MNDPTIVTVEDAPAYDPHWVADVRERSAKAMEAIPARYRDAVADLPEVAAWVRAVFDATLTQRRTIPLVRRGPSLLLVGSTGTGKTYQCWGAIRAFGVSGVSCGWVVTTAADLYAKLRPRPRVDPEDEFEKVANVGLLVLDDLGAAKSSEWVEEINYRLINHRYEHEMPTLITSNVPPKNLGEALGERVASRLVEMATRVVLKGADRRLGGAA